MPQQPDTVEALTAVHQQWRRSMADPVRASHPYGTVPLRTAPE